MATSAKDASIRIEPIADDNPGSYESDAIACKVGEPGISESIFGGR